MNSTTETRPASEAEAAIYRPEHHVRMVTATSLFDGHDAAINIIRRILQDTGVEVIHLGHNRTAEEIVNAAIDEDVQGIAVSCYQGGHMEFFKYIVDLLNERGAGGIKVFGGGGGVIVLDEIRELEAYGVEKIYSPDDGASMGLQGMINDLVRRIDRPGTEYGSLRFEELARGDRIAMAQIITAAELYKEADPDVHGRIMDRVRSLGGSRRAPVIGFTGTGGAGKSSLIDEFLVRHLREHRNSRVAVMSSDPSRRRTGGALLGDRIRMNSAADQRVYMRSFATRRSDGELSGSIADAIAIARAAGFDLIVAETAGTGQADAHILGLVDVSVYVMTGEYGAPSQLEKIAMLDYADVVVLNKFEKQGSDDALRDVRKQVQRNRRDFNTPAERMPVFGTIAARFNDEGVTSLYRFVADLAAKKEIGSGGETRNEMIAPPRGTTVIVPQERVRYLSEIADAVRLYHRRTADQADRVRALWHLQEAERLVGGGDGAAAVPLKEAQKKWAGLIDGDTGRLLEEWEALRESYKSGELVYHVRGREHRVPLYAESLAGKKIPKVALPDYRDPGEIYRWLREENVPGRFPFTAGVFPLKRMDEDPTRMFAGEGGPARTNRRFRLLSADFEAKRLSTAFDSVTLYGCDPDRRPDIYGKVGTSGVSICTLDDMKVLYGGFDLCSPQTSVSMTINGPAPIMLAMFLNTAIDQRVDRFMEETGREPDTTERENLRAQALRQVRGTVQADILKEDQGQNTCIFSIDFALKMMGDIQQFLIDNEIRNLYSVSISGYHIAEAGANPITQLAFTLANGFTYVEYYLSRGMAIDCFAPNLSFFFSNGMDPEYTVIGRVARRIWAVALRDRYGASERSQMLKYHIQTSGRSLHSREIQFNDIRTTLQALCAVYDNCNSLHTNAFDEAITTPSEESVRRALAIQQIINREWGLAKNENPQQGSFIVRELTELVEEAVLMEFDRITERGGVLGAMEKGYQRSRIQEESLHYEQLKHSGEYPIVGVNTFLREGADEEIAALPLARASDEEKDDQLARLAAFRERNAADRDGALARLQQLAVSGGNVFAELMNAVRHCSLGEITGALYQVGGRYRRTM